MSIADFTKNSQKNSNIAKTKKKLKSNLKSPISQEDSSSYGQEELVISYNNPDLEIVFERESVFNK